MKITLSKAQLDKARMVRRGSYNKIEVVIDGKVRRLGESKIHKDTKLLIAESYPHLIVHGSSSYNNWFCRCHICTDARAVYSKPYADKRRSIKKDEFKDRIMRELNLSTYECASCRSTIRLEADHTDANNKLMNINSLKDYLEKPKLQAFIKEEIKKCQILCKACHIKSYNPDIKIGWDRNRSSTPWLSRIKGKPVSPWRPTQVIPLLEKLGYQPGDNPRVLTEEEWDLYRDYANSINKPSIQSPFKK